MAASIQQGIEDYKSLHKLGAERLMVRMPDVSLQPGSESLPPGIDVTPAEGLRTFTEEQTRTGEPQRYRATELADRLGKLVSTTHDDEYWWAYSPPAKVQVPKPSPYFEQPQASSEIHAVIGQHTGGAYTHPENGYSLASSPPAANRRPAEPSPLHNDMSDAESGYSSRPIRSAVTVESNLAPEIPNYKLEIGQRILEHLTASPNIVRHFPTESFKATFEVEWDLMAFLEKQSFEGAQADVIDIFVTLTGSSTDAQALTCIRYLEQTWGASSASIVDLIKQVVRNFHEKHTCDLPNGTMITAWISWPYFMVEAIGFLDLKTRSNDAEYGT
ncbi:hypothetical protein E8E13_008584 [Curvularia kusanoi]|uniref:Uncharacterized protein n=1 Tax=Curvularia kusanoi TaxID=90978 RepID=A0A9P4TBV0_CURKU|nr:hypothetical protein E8E13_008584 [Curvularia kusanoi]